MAKIFKLVIIFRFHIELLKKQSSSNPTVFVSPPTPALYIII